MNTHTQDSVAHQHTPGPFRIGDAGMTIFGPKTDEPSPVVVAHLPQPSPRVSAQERAANRALLVAAPDLLAALIELKDEYDALLAEHGKPFRWGKLPSLKAQDAIARATNSNS